MIGVLFDLFVEVAGAVVQGCLAASRAEEARVRERKAAASWNAFANARGMQSIRGGHRVSGQVGGAPITIDTGAWAESNHAITIFSPSLSSLRVTLDQGSMAKFPNCAAFTSDMRAGLEALRAPFELTCDASWIKLVIAGPLGKLDAIDAACSTVSALARGQSLSPYR